MPERKLKLGLWERFDDCMSVILLAVGSHVQFFNQGMDMTSFVVVVVIIVFFFYFFLSEIEWNVAEEDKNRSNNEIAFRQKTMIILKR